MQGITEAQIRSAHLLCWQPAQTHRLGPPHDRTRQRSHRMDTMCRQVLKKQASALRSERRRSGAMLQELQGLRECEQQACGQLKLLLAANAELASRNAQLECENSGLLVRHCTALQIAAHIAAWCRHAGLDAALCAGADGAPGRPGPCQGQLS